MPWRNWRGPQLLRTVEQGAREAVRKTCKVILAGAKEEVPLDEGTLQDSGSVTIHPSKAAGCVSFGGGQGTGHPIVPYARRWHENSANFQHGRKKRYLADPVNRLGADTLRQALQEEIGGRLR